MQFFDQIKTDTSHNKGTLASLLRHHYEKILYPFDLFVQGVLASSAADNCELNSENNIESEPSSDKRIKLDSEANAEVEIKSNETAEIKNESKPLRVSPRRLSRRLNGCQENNINSPNKGQKCNIKNTKSASDANSSSQDAIESNETPVSNLLI